MGTKIEGDRCYDAAMPDEPMFVLLARDPTAPELVRLWADTRQTDIQCGLRPVTDAQQVVEARALADRMEAWRRDANEAWRKQPQLPLGVTLAAGDALLYGTGAFTLDEDGRATHVPLDELSGVPMQGRHFARRENDELVCSKCSKRWACDEEPPACV